MGDSTIQELRESSRVRDMRVNRRDEGLASAEKAQDNMEESLELQEKELFDGPFMRLICRAGGVSRLTMFNRKWHSFHSGRKGSLNAAKLLWGYESFDEAKRYVDAYFHGE